MDNPKHILGIILARGGSKSIPKKSIALCAGKPLMYYTIKAAKESKLLTRIIISTDDEEMAEIARSYGVEVPFLRPKELAEDLTPDLPVFIHALKHLYDSEGYMPDVVVHLRPTTPLKKGKDIDTGVQLLLDNPDAESVRSVCEPLHTPFKMYTESGGYLEPLLTNVFPEVFAQYPEAFNMPRQLLPKVLRHSGYVDVIRPRVITQKNSMSGTKIIPLYFEKWRDVDIDSVYEIKLAEQIILSKPEEFAA
ncbi:acylneuraminate cytidylyltransferase family protein [Candidatus Nomurabacteria bacterium]|jgi:CMP-N,N'-diacetyllegionaminic acid synthase|nr:MAG: acylneuraminate cytidylyltransferase family protein [Candidatus Nomurabacteria bacterium]